MNQKIILILLSLITITVNISAQVVQDSTFEATIPAKFQGDDSGQKFNQFILSVIIYPDTKKALEGRVYAQFIIDTTGSISDINIIRSLRDDYDQALINALLQSPKWSPATLENRPVPYKMVYPIFFTKKR